MAQNPIPEAQIPLVALAEDAADGANEHEANLVIMQNTEARIRADLATYTAAEGAVLARRADKQTASAALRTADSNGKAFIALFIRTGKTTIGPEWNSTWEEAGFTDGSLAVPGTGDARFILLGKLRDFLTANPGYAVTVPGQPSLDVTAAIATTRYNAVSTARFNANVANSDNGTAIAARDAAKTALRSRLTGLRVELGQLMEDDDPRWYAFGFSRPADPDTPGVPEGLVATLGAVGSGILILDWDDARRATGYKVFVLLQGETEPQEFGIFEDSQRVITLPPGSLAEITVVSHNTHGIPPIRKARP